MNEGIQLIGLCIFIVVIFTLIGIATYEIWTGREYKLKGYIMEMTKKEWIQAMLDGEKVTSDNIVSDTIDYIEFKDDSIRYSDGSPVTLSFHTKGLRLFTEPKTKIKVAKYAYKLLNSNKWTDTIHYFKDEVDFTCSIIANLSEFKRLDYTEIEV